MWRVLYRAVPVATAVTALLVAWNGTAAAAVAAPDRLAMTSASPTIAIAGEPLTLAYINTYGAELPTGTLFVRNDTQPGFTTIPMVAGPSPAGTSNALVGKVPAAQVSGRELRFYATFRDPASGRTVTVPAAGPAGADRAMVVTDPIEVPLGTYQYGQLTAPAAVVARAGPTEVGWQRPAGDGPRIGPQSFDIAADGAVWLLDNVNRRLLRWSPGSERQPSRVVPLAFAPLDFALGPDGMFYVTETAVLPERGMFLNLVAASGTRLWRVPLATQSSNVMLRMGPRQELYGVDAGQWIPFTSPDNIPVGVDDQRRGTEADQPLAGWRHLVVTRAGIRDIRAAIVDRTGRPIRVWRVTGQIDLHFADGPTPAVLGEDVALAFHPFNIGSTVSPAERLVVRLSASGLATRVQFDQRHWGEFSVTDHRVGPDGSYYQLRTDVTTGVSIVRYAFGAPVVQPTPSGSAPPATPPATVAPTQVTPGAGTAPATAPPAAGTGSGSWTWLFWAGGSGLLIVIVLSGIIWWRRRRAVAAPTPDESTADDDLVGATVDYSHHESIPHR
jgi:hypothetical protein